jgi:GNAT superfamily N-acetyltransferase
VTSQLDSLLRRVEQGEFPAADMGVTHVPQPSAGIAAVLGFTGHTVVAADVDAELLTRELPASDPGAAFNPPFLTALTQALGMRVSNIDIVTMAPRRPGPPSLTLHRVDDQTHPRVRRALRYRTDITVWGCRGGVVLIGRGLGDRWEMAVEVEPEFRGRGLGRALAEAATHLVPADRPLWAQIGVGNAASVRALLAAGFVPVGEEALLLPLGPATT